MTSGSLLPPPVMWAQRNNMLLVTVCLEDCKNPSVKMEPDKLHFKGTGGTDQKDYEVTMEWYGTVDPENSKHFIRDRNIEFYIRKKEEGPYWPRLLKDKSKHHWLKVDFNKWKDEDDSDDEAGGSGQDLEEMMRQMGGLGDAGGVDKPNLDDLYGESDSDDEDLPDLE